MMYWKEYCKKLSFYVLRYTSGFGCRDSWLLILYSNDMTHKYVKAVPTTEP